MYFTVELQLSFLITGKPLFNQLLSVELSNLNLKYLKTPKRTILLIDSSLGNCSQSNEGRFTIQFAIICFPRIYSRGRYVQ